MLLLSRLERIAESIANGADSIEKQVITFSILAFGCLEWSERKSFFAPSFHTVELTKTANQEVLNGLSKCVDDAPVANITLKSVLSVTWYGASTACYDGGHADEFYLNCLRSVKELEGWVFIFI